MYCVAVVVVCFIVPQETHSVTPFSFTDEWENAMLSLGGWRRAISNNKWQTTPSSTRVCSKIVSLIKKTPHLLIVRVGIFKIYAYYLSLFHPSLSHPPHPSHRHPSLSHSLLSSLSLSLPLSLFAVNKRLKMTVLKTPTGHQKIIVSALFTVRECFLPF